MAEWLHTKQDNLITQGWDAEAAAFQEYCQNAERGMKMNKKSKMIIGLLAVAVVLFCLIRFWIIPADQAKKETYAQNQTDALTHDISAIEDYRTAYLGDSTNVIELFGALPLNNIPKRFEINSDDCTLTVNYLDTVWDIREDTVQRDLVYNTVAAMAAIDNLSGITYNFSGDSYSFDRAQMEEVFGAPLSDLLDQKTWNKNVQDKLKDAGFVGQFYKAPVQPSG